MKSKVIVDKSLDNSNLGVGEIFMNDCYEYMVNLGSRRLGEVDRRNVTGRLCDRVEPYTVDEIMVEFVRERRYRAKLEMEMKSDFADSEVVNG